MDLTTIITSVITSGVVSAIISGVVALRINERRIAIENITQERTKWREKIRQNNKDVQKAFLEKNKDKLRELKANLCLLLNPLDPLDKDIIKELDLMQAAGSKDDDLNRFAIKVSLLLKHDWERAKQEATASVWRREKIKRVSYEEYLKSEG